MDAARSMLSAASLPVLDEHSPPDASGFRVLPYNDVCVMVAPVIDGQQGAGLLGPTGLMDRWPGVMDRWRTMNRQAIDAITAEGWEHVAGTWDGGAFSPPAEPLHPQVKETIHVLERDGEPGYAQFAVSLLPSGAVKVGVAGGWNCRELSLNNVASPALYAAGFSVQTVREEETAGWWGVEYLEVRPPSERHEEWALAHALRRLLQSQYTHVGWDVHFSPALESHMPDDAAPEAHRGALLFQFAGHAVHHPYAFDYTLRDAGYVITPSRNKRWRHMRILRPAPAAQ